MTCMVRVLITHSEGRTLIAVAGFFTYMFCHSAYQNWLKSEGGLDKIWTVESDDG